MLVCHTLSGGGGSGGKLGKSRPPRVISEIRKGESARDHFLHFRPKVSADLLVLIGADQRWQPRRVQVRAGQLQLSPVQGLLAPSAQQNSMGTRIPLRHLSLQAGASAYSLALVRGKAILLTLQTADERQFDLWVKHIAIEIIRQTPLEDVKYLDVFPLTTKDPPTVPAPVPPFIAESPAIIPTTSLPPAVTTTAESVCTSCKPIIHFDEWDLNKNIITMNNNNITTNVDSVEVLLKKCQSSESYVPVKEKLMLFESLCRIGRGRSAEDVSIGRLVVGGAGVSKRARSLHDLTYCCANGGVREICKYFETKCEDGGVVAHPPTGGRIKRLVHSDTSLNKVAFNARFENVSYA